MLSDRCLSCPVCLVLSIPLVYCGQTVGRIQTKLGTQVGLGPGHTASDRNLVFPPQKRHNVPQVSAHICCGQIPRWIKMPTGKKVGLDPSDIVLDGHPASPPQKGAEPQFRPVSIVPKRLDGSRRHLVWRQARPKRHCVTCGLSSPPQKVCRAPNFRPMYVVAKRLHGWTKMPLGTMVSLDPGNIVLDADPAPPQLRGTISPPKFRPISIVAKWLDGSRRHLVRR